MATGGAASAESLASGPSVRVQLAEGPYRVGQSVAVDVTLIASGQASDSPRIDPPRISQADLFPMEPSSRSVPRSWQFLLVARRAGPLTILPFRIQWGDRWVTSKPATISVAPLPQSGRTPAFLGGVGDLQVSSKVDPTTIHLGETFAFRIELTGPGALGSNVAPDLRSWADLPIAIEVRDSSTLVNRDDPPSRVFLYQLRARSPGDAVLPPIRVATFDPSSRRYSTRSTASVTLKVTGPPQFDPSRIDFGSRTIIDPNSLRANHALIWLILGGLVATGVIIWFGRAWRGQRAEQRVNWQREAVQLRRLTRSELPRSELAEAIVERLAGIVTRATRHPMAVLTPLEAKFAFEEITTDHNLGVRAESLVAALDQVRFDPATEATAGDSVRWVAEAVAILEAVGRSQARPGWLCWGR